MSKDCPNCFTSNRSTSTFCSRCGTRLPAAETDGEMTPPSPYQWMNDSKPPQPVVPQSPVAPPPQTIAQPQATLFSCPDCGRMCSMSAQTCPQCGHPFVAPAQQRRPPQQPLVPQPLPYSPPVPMPAPPPVQYVQYPPPYYQQPQQQVWSPGAAGVLSFIIPGLGQVYKGNVGSGLLWFFFVLVGYAMLILPGLLLHIICIVAATSGNPYRKGG